MTRSEVVLVRAAAGCGKTTELARRYLGFVAEGIDVEQAIAITFTRRAAAELVERVTLALRAVLDGPVGEAARARLGSAWPLYREVGPTDPAVARRALAALPSAPIGTTDRFVHALLTEHALDAAVPLPDGGAAPIDVPIRPTTSLKAHLDRAARRVLDPPGDGVDPDVALLTRYFGLDEVLGWLSDASAYDALPIATTRDVMGFVAASLARVLREVDLVEAWPVDDPGSPEAWAAALDGATNVDGVWAIGAVAPWLAAGLADPAPFELAGWLKGLNKRSKARRALAQRLGAERLDLGPASLTLAEIVDAMRYPYDDRSHVELADRIQGARERLRARVVAEALRTSADAGQLDHGSLTAAAIALCQAAPARLRGRYAALLVDEVQDASPDQLALYDAIARIPGDRPVRTVMVGDVRQSIYLFRGAEPAGFSGLIREAAGGRGALVDLEVNHRSHPALVDAHRALFAAIDGPMQAEGYAPIDDLSGLKANPGNAALAPASSEPRAPVWVVSGTEGEEIRFYEADDRALHAFVGRVAAARAEPGHAHDTAVVLTPSWRTARESCARIRAWAGRDDAAFVDGGGAWLSGVVGADLRHLLRALLDPTDDLAWLALWKHPMIGLSDAGLARVRAGVGMVVDGPDGEVAAPDWCRSLGRALDADRLVAPHDPADRRAWIRARDALRDARARIGRDEIAGTLDALAHRLDWRLLLAAGPGGEDDVAALEVALDHVRELEAEAAAPDAVLAALEPDEGGDLPHVHLDRPAGSISCTTVFQAKGLAWDHVCVRSPARAPRPHDPDPPRIAWVRLDGRPHRIVGLKFDPLGALTPFKDPVGRLGNRIAAFRTEEECARLAYVAITRARRTVTFGVPGRFDHTSPMQRICAQAWSRPELVGAAIAHVPWPAAPSAARAPTGWVRVAERPPAPALPPAGRTWSVRQPSSYASHHDVETRRNDALGTADRVRLGNGLHLGVGRSDPPVADWPALRPTDWGDIAHGWLAHWGFRGAPEIAVARSWLAEAWGADAPDIAAWLVALGQGLEAAGGPLWAAVTDPEARLLFEHPLVGVAGRRDDVVLSGRIDLLVVHGRSCTVIDFKAGERGPTGFDDLVDHGGLRTYGPQLDAYRAALETADRKVDRVGLWFVRTGTQVLW